MELPTIQLNGGGPGEHPQSYNRGDTKGLPIVELDGRVPGGNPQSYIRGVTLEKMSPITDASIDEGPPKVNLHNYNRFDSRSESTTGPAGENPIITDVVSEIFQKR